MSKYIEADALFKWYEGQRTKYPIKGDSPQFGTLMMYEIFDEIEDAPTIDIVQCRECKYIESEEVEVPRPYGFSDYYKEFGCKRIREHTGEWYDVYFDGFCSYGEREGEYADQ